MKKSTKIIGLMQAAGLVLYVTAFAVLAQNFQIWMRMQNGKPDNPVLAMTTFLLAFIISALVSASCVFAYPIFTFVNGNKKEAFAVVGWNFFWIVLFFAAIVACESFGFIPL